MFGLFKKKCNHDWHYMLDEYVYENCGAYIEAEDGCRIICVKCEKEQVVYKHEWNRIMRRQEILKANKE